MHKAEQDRRLIQFLMGLNEIYTVVRGSILMMSPLPTMAQAFAILAQEERQREVKPHNRLNLDSTSLNVVANTAGTSSAMVNAASTSYRTNYTGMTHPQYRNSGGSRPPNKLNLICDYCRKPGHTKDKCYRLHGFPQNFKFTKGKNSATAANVYGETANMGGRSYDDNTSHGQQHHNLTTQQYDQLLNLLEHIQIQGGNMTGGSTKEMAENLIGGAVNFAGILACYSSITDIGDLTCKCIKLSADSWIIDSGATNHMTYN